MIIGPLERSHGSKNFGNGYKDWHLRSRVTFEGGSSPCWEYGGWHA